MRIESFGGQSFNTEINKFFTIDKNFYNSILNNYLWFSDPRDFNDPYDLNLNLLIPNYNDEELLSLAILLKSKGLNVTNTNDELVNFFKQRDYLKNLFQKWYLNNFVPSLGICCFSQCDDNILMWSHYADKHKGICLKFDMDLDKIFFEIPLVMDYPDVYPIFDWLRNRENEGWLVKFLLGQKSKDWKYESEIRICKNNLLYQPFTGKITFKKESLKEMIFGYKTDDVTIDNLKTLMLGIGYRCSFSKFELKSDAYGLVKIPV